MTGPQVELYTAEAIATGRRPERVELRDVLEAGDRIRIPGLEWTPLSANPGPGPHGDAIQIDEIIVAVDGLDGTRVVHANWHDVVLEAGPYRVSGLLAVLPGFDPGRALTRPGGNFIELRDARMELIGHPEAGEVERVLVLVNRYAVDVVASDLILAFWFPAARFETLQGQPVG